MTHRRDQTKAVPSWYTEKREGIAKIFESSKPGEVSVVMSPSGKYRLEVSAYETGPNSWSYSRGLVFEGGELIAQIDRNYGAFPFSWCEKHLNGHSYLICGEDYQCQTVIELDTRKRMDYIDPRAEAGVAFCWAAHYPSPDGSRLFVDGCYWAAPYDLVLFDFSDPMHLPYPELYRWEWPVEKVHGFMRDGSFVFDYSREVRRSDGALVDELPDDECEELDNAPDYTAVVRDQIFRVVWRPDRAAEVHPLNDEAAMLELLGDSQV